MPSAESAHAKRKFSARNTARFFPRSQHMRERKGGTPDDGAPQRPAGIADKRLRTRQHTH